MKTIPVLANPPIPTAATLFTLTEIGRELGEFPIWNEREQLSSVDAGQVLFNPSHDAKGRFAPRAGARKAPTAKVAEKTPTPSQKSILAKQTSRYVGRDVQRYSEEICEAQLAKGLKGVGMKALELRDNEPADVLVTKGGKITDGIELKTMTDNRNNKLTMKASAIAKKERWMVENGADFHTVVFNDEAVFNAHGPGMHGSQRKRKIFYRRGSGSFRVGSMHPVANLTELRTLLETPTADLPAAALPPLAYKGFK